MDFESHSSQARNKCKDLAQKPLELIPELFSKTVDWIKIQQYRQRPDEWIPDYYERFKKLLSNILTWHLNHSLTTKMILCLDEDLATLGKRHNLSWPTLHTNALVTLADQLSKPLKEKGGFMKIMNFQLHQLSTQCQLKVNWPLFNSQPVEKASLEEKLILILEG